MGNLVLGAPPHGPCTRWRRPSSRGAVGMPQRAGIQGIQGTTPCAKLYRVYNRVYSRVYRGYTGGIQQVYSRYTGLYTGRGYTGVYRQTRHPHHIKSWGIQGYTAQRVYRGYTARILEEHDPHCWGVYRVYSHPSVHHLAAPMAGLACNVGATAAS